MSTLFALFAIIAVPILFFMLTWVVVTACRIFFPEKPPVIERNASVMRRRQAAEEGVSIPVGVREIREDQRHLFIQRSDTSYHYSHGDSEGLPISWFEELHDRRN